MRAEPTQEELFAFELVRSVLDVEVDGSGETREPGHVDAVLNYRSGDQAAMEVTILCDRDAVQLWKLLAKNDFRWTVDGSALWWNVAVDSKVRLKELNTHLPELIRLHEQYGVTGPDWKFPMDAVDQSPALQWMEQQRIEVWGHDNVSDAPKAVGRRPGTVTVLPKGDGGAVGDDADIVPTWLSEQAAKDPQVRSKIDKLQASGYDEQHLFLVVDLSVASFSFVYAVSATDAVPTASPVLGSVTHLWLVPTHMFGNTYLTWDAKSGWARRSLPQPLELTEDAEPDL